ncbi:hypothetical protein GGF31_008287 [Allomyces arbusculus]|nr:hypothetical protein GGF31_008287 [Allomyces arbusculus]
MPLLPPQPICTPRGNGAKHDDLPLLSVVALVASLPLAVTTTVPPDVAAMTTHGGALLYASAPNRDRTRIRHVHSRAANLGEPKATGLVWFMFEFGLGVGVSFAV